MSELTELVNCIEIARNALGRAVAICGKADGELLPDGYGRTEPWEEMDTLYDELTAVKADMPIVPTWLTEAAHAEDLANANE